MQKRFSGGKFIVPKQASDAGDRCLRILKSVGTRAKNLNYLGKHQLITSVRVISEGSANRLASIVAPSLWVVSRYFKDNPTMITVDNEFETVWGWKACEISETWRQHNEARKLEAGQTKKITAGGSSSQSIGRHLGELTIRGPPVATASSSSIAPVDDPDDSPRQQSSSTTSRYPESDRRTLPSLKAVGLLDSFENRRTNTESRSVLPPLSKAREW